MRSGFFVAFVVLLACGGDDDASRPDAGTRDTGGFDVGEAMDAPGVDVGDGVDAGPGLTGRFVVVETALTEPQWNETHPIPCTLGDSLACEALEEGGGVAVRDVDGDGDLDVFLTHFEARDRLYLNQGDFVFVESPLPAYTEELFSNGAAFADIDEDGDPDLLVGTVGEPRYYLLVNDGAGGFTEEAVARGVHQTETEGGFHSTMTHCFGDLDQDGFLDLVTSEWRVPREGVTTTRNSVLINRGVDAPGSFADATATWGVAMLDVDGADPGAWGFTPTLIDADLDGRTDLLFAADFGASRLYWNEGATFVDGTDAAGVGGEENGMGSAVGDIDGDGDLDWFVSSIANPDCAGCEAWGKTGNRLYRNDGGRGFTDITDEAGVRDAGWAWGAAFFDFDHDGDLDLLVTNGMRSAPDVTGFARDRTVLWQNDGTGRFTDVSARFGLTHDGVGRAVAPFDADGDGDLDLLLTHSLDAPIVFRNEVADGRAWLEVAPVGRGGGAGSNRDGVGAVVRVVPEDGAPAMVRVAGNGCGFLTSTPGVPHFGLAARDTVARVEVTWPRTGATQVLTDVATRQRVVVMEE